MQFCEGSRRRVRVTWLPYLYSLLLAAPLSLQGIGGGSHSSSLRPPSWHLGRRSRRPGGGFLLSFLCTSFVTSCHLFVALYILLGQPWAVCKGELQWGACTNRGRGSDSGQKLDCFFFAARLMDEKT